MKVGDTILDPFCGTGNLITTIARNQIVDGDYKLNDDGRDSVYLGTLNLLLNGIKNFEYFKSDSFRRTSPIHKGVYDWVITDPPMGNLTNWDYRGDFFSTQFKNSNRYENLTIQMIIELLSSSGKAFVIVPEGFCTSSSVSSAEIRKYLVDNDYLDCVISLPQGIYKPYTNIKTSLLIIDKQKSDSQKERIFFWELENFQTFQNIDDLSFQEMRRKTNYRDNSVRIQVVPTEAVRNQGYQINSNRFIRLSSLKQVLNGRSLKTILNSYNSGKRVEESKLSYISGVPYITIKDLSNSQTDFILNTDNLEVFISESEYGKFPNKYLFVKNKSILVAKIGQNLKPTLVASDKQYIISNNILMLSVKENLILPEYLLSQLRESYVTEQIEAIRKGSAQPYFTTDDFLRITINVPSLAEQREVVTDLYNHIIISSKRLIGNLESEKLDDLVKILSSLKHEFSGRKRRFESEIDNLETFINKKIASNEKISWMDQVSNTRTLRSLFNDTQGALDYLKNIFDDIPQIVKLGKDGLDKKPVHIKSFIKKQLSRFQQGFHENNIHLHVIEGKDYQVNIDIDKFSYVIDNIIENAIKHAFKKENVHKLIEVEVRLSDDQQFVEIDIKDNGKGLDQGFSISDYIKLWEKSGNNKGTGLGGHLIYLVVKYHGGKLHFIDDPKLKGPFNFYLRISIPSIF
jgi:signal transduction histidine kinase